MKGEGELGSDKGDDNRKGEVGVQRFDGKDIFESEETKDRTGTSDFSEGGSSTVGRDIFRVPFFPEVVCSSIAGSAILI